MPRSLFLDAGQMVFSLSGGWLGYTLWVPLHPVLWM
jgi:hypothetical protein